MICMPGFSPTCLPYRGLAITILTQVDDLYKERFIVYLTTLLVTQTIQRQIIGWLMDNESERIWKEAVVALFMILHRHLPRGTEDNLIMKKKKLSEGSQCSSRHSNTALSERKKEALPF
jgi:hypothetical protein